MLLVEFHGLLPVPGFGDVHHVWLAIDNRAQPDTNHEMILHDHGANPAVCVGMVHGDSPCGGALQGHLHKQLGSLSRPAGQRQVAADSLGALPHSNQSVVPA